MRQEPRKRLLDVSIIKIALIVLERAVFYGARSIAPFPRAGKHSVMVQVYANFMKSFTHEMPTGFSRLCHNCSVVEIRLLFYIYARDNLKYIASKLKGHKQAEQYLCHVEGQNGSSPFRIQTSSHVKEPACQYITPDKGREFLFLEGRRRNDARMNFDAKSPKS